MLYRALKSHKTNLFVISLVAASFISLGFKFFRFIIRYSENIVVWDQWDVFDYIVKDTNLLGILSYQHNEHRIGLSLLVEKILAYFTSWNTQIETIFIGILIFSASIVALLLKRKLSGKFEIYDIIIPYLFLNLYQWENLIWGFQIGFVLPLFWLLIVTFTYTLENSFKRNLAITILSLVSAYSHFHGLFVGLISVLFFFLNLFKVKVKKERLEYFLFLVLNVLVVSSYFVGYRKAPFYGTTDLNIKEHLLYIFVQINGFWGNHSINILTALVPLLAVVMLCKSFWASLKSQKFAKVWPICALFIFSLLFSLSTSFGRAGLGSASGITSRYMTLVIPMYFGMYLYLALDVSKKLKGVILPFVLIVFVFISSQNNFVNYKEAVMRKERLSGWKSCYLEKSDYAYCDREIGMTTYHSPQKISLDQKLEYLKERRLNFFR